MDFSLYCIVHSGADPARSESRNDSSSRCSASGYQEAPAVTVIASPLPPTSLIPFFSGLRSLRSRLPILFIDYVLLHVVLELLENGGLRHFLDHCIGSHVSPHDANARVGLVLLSRANRRRFLQAGGGHSGVKTRRESRL